MNQTTKLALVGAAVLGGYLILNWDATPPEDATPIQPNVPTPVVPAPIVPAPIQPTPAPKPRPCPRYEMLGATVAGPQWNGLDVMTELPPSLQAHNISSRGQGCCVFRSTDHAGRYADIPQVIGFPEWIQSKGEPGGGTPHNWESRLKAISAERGLPVPEYMLIVDGKDPSILAQALQTGHMVCITYSHSPSGRYNNQHIAHMVNLVYADGTNFAVLDNNYCGTENCIEWMNLQEFQSSCMSGGTYWAHFFLKPGPPPIPKNPKGGQMIYTMATMAALMAPSAPEPNYEWKPFADNDPSQVQLTLNGVQVGVYKVETGEYFPIRTLSGVRTFGVSCAPPVPYLNQGIGNYRNTKAGYYLNGVSVTPDAASHAIQQSAPLPTTNKPHLVLIGSKADTDKAATTIQPYADKLVVHSYAPDFWFVGANNLKPGATILASDGTAMHYQPTLDSPTLTAAVATAVGAKPDPNNPFDPSKVPDLTKPTVVPLLPVLPIDKSTGTLAIVCGGLVTMFVLTRKKQV